MQQEEVDTLVKEVRITLDENQVEDDYLKSSTDNLELDEIIRAKLTDAARAVIEVCPVELLEPEPFPGNGAGTIVRNDDGSGSVKLPDDFLRLIRFKLTTWNRAVVFVESEGSEGDRIQRNKFTRGNAMKPSCVFSHNASGDRILEYFTAGRNANGAYDHTVETALYAPAPAITKTGGKEYLALPRLLRPCIINYCAGLVEVSRGNTAQADVFFKIATSYFNKEQ